MSYHYNTQSRIDDRFKSVVMFNPRQFVEPGLSEKDIIDLKEVFDKFDLDSSGYISPVELRVALLKYGKLNAHKNTIYHIIAEYDKDMNGELSFKDFLKIAGSYPKRSQSRSEIQSVFNEYDKDKKGYITLEDIRKVNKETGEDMNDQELMTILFNCGDGNKITFDEFYHIMNQ